MRVNLCACTVFTNLGYALSGSNHHVFYFEILPSLIDTLHVVAQLVEISQLTCYFFISA